MVKFESFLTGATAPLACAVVAAMLSLAFACTGLEIAGEVRVALAGFSALLAAWCVAMTIERLVSPLFGALRAHLRAAATRLAG